MIPCRLQVLKTGGYVDIYLFIHSFIVVLRQVHNLFQSDFSAQCDLGASFFNFQYPLFPCVH